MINPEKIKSVQAKIKAALDLIEKEENVQISFGNCSYTPAYYKTGMTVTSQEKSEKVDNLLVRHGYKSRIERMNEQLKINIPHVEKINMKIN